MTEQERIIAEIDTYCRFAKIAPSTLGMRAGYSGKFYERMCAGKRAWPETLDRIRRYMADNPPKN